MNKMSEYGLPVDNVTTNGGFYLWSGQETDARGAYVRVFFSVYTDWLSNDYRDISYPNLWAVCVGE